MIMLKYTIKAVIEVEANEPRVMVDLLEELEGYGEVTVENVEVIKEV
jgi:hypothetical protein